LILTERQTVPWRMERDKERREQKWSDVMYICGYSTCWLCVERPDDKWWMAYQSLLHFLTSFSLPSQFNLAYHCYTFMNEFKLLFWVNSEVVSACVCGERLIWLRECHVVESSVWFWTTRFPATIESELTFSPMLRILL
jgi:hypothetical protein